MTSAINTNGINVNYPVPGINNSSQGFRDNFTAIKTDLNTAATEITDLQNNVVLKQPLTGTTLNNDMANTLISNAATRGFRATTYNLGNAMSGTVVVNVSLGDVQYGTIAGNTSIQFAGWAPSGTQSNVQLQFAVSNANAVLTFPSEVVFANNTLLYKNFPPMADFYFTHSFRMKSKIDINDFDVPDSIKPFLTGGSIYRYDKHIPKESYFSFN